MTEPLLLRARVVMPIERPPLDDGAVRVAGGAIAAVGRWRDLAVQGSARVLDLGDMVLAPGLINAHCHLDYTHMAGQLQPGASFVDWIKAILALKSGWSLDQYAASWRAGAAMLLQSGTTTVVDVEAVPELLPGIWDATPLRVFSCLELTGVRSRLEPQVVLRETVEKAVALPVGRCQVGLAPHAPYSTIPELLRQTRSVARQHGWRMTTHLAESVQEYEMFAAGRGVMYEWLRRNGRDMSDCGGTSPVQYLHRQGMLANDLLAVHVNYLAPERDAQLLGGHGVSVAHCPRSHAYFGHRPFPWRELRQAGVNLCLGTDSLATVTGPANASLDLFAEMQRLLTPEVGISPEQVLRMATANGALALGLEGRRGVLAPGADADLIAIPFGGPLDQSYEGVARQTGGAVAAVMIDGQWVVAPWELS